MVQSLVIAMPFNSLARFIISRPQQCLGAMFIALLLLPAQSYAAISNFTWSVSGPTSVGQNPFASFDTSLSTSSSGVLLLYLSSTPPTFTANPSTWSFTAFFDITGSATSLGGNWQNLNSISNISGGTVNVKVVGASQNMFGTSSGVTYGFSNPPPAGTIPLTPTDQNGVGTGYAVTITLTFSEDVTFQTSPSTPIRLTLQ